MSQTKEQIEQELQVFKDANPDWMSVEWKTNFVTAGDNRLASFPRALPGTNRARLASVFFTQHVHLPPRGMMFDGDFVITSELVQLLADLKEQQGAFVDTFARALRRMKEFEKAMLGEENVYCALCDRTNRLGYECITCHQWVCEFCFPQVMRAEVRTTVVVLPNGVEEIHLKCPHCRGSFNEPIGPTVRNSCAYA